MAANPILICAPTDELRAELETQLGSVGYVTTSVTTPAAAVGALRDGSFDLVLAEGLAVSGAIGRIRAAASEPTPVLVVAPADDVEARIAFLEAGADDVVSTGFASHELAAKVEALLIRAGRVTPEAARSSLPSGEIVTFFSPKGGVGTTTLAVNTAVLLAGGMPGSGPGAKVLLVDMDLQFGQVATHLNLSPRFDLAGLAGDEPALSDPELAMSYLTPALVRGPGAGRARPIPTPTSASRVDQLERALAILRPRFDEVIVDCGSPPGSAHAVDAGAGVDPRLRHLPGDRRAARHQRPAGLPGRRPPRCVPRRTSW